MNVNKETQRLWNMLIHFIVADKRNKCGVNTFSAIDPITDSLPPSNPHQPIGLYLGSELAPDVMRYAIAACIRLSSKLAVFTFQSVADAQALLTPYQTQLENARIALQLAALSGEPPLALIHALRQRREIPFLICNEFGYLARSLKKGIVSQEGFPVPVIMVGTIEAAMPKPAPVTASPIANHAA